MSSAGASINYRQGDATQPEADGARIIVHICNDVGGWGAGFVLALSRRWATPEQHYRDWYEGRGSNDFGLGAVEFVEVEPSLWVANMIGQHGVSPTADGPPIRYEAVETALERVADRASDLGASVHMPRIGCGLAGGSWDRIEPLIAATLLAKDINVVVYDFE